MASSGGCLSSEQVAIATAAPYAAVEKSVSAFQDAIVLPTLPRHARLQANQCQYMYSVDFQDHSTKRGPCKHDAFQRKACDSTVSARHRYYKVRKAFKMCLVYVCVCNGMQTWPLRSNIPTRRFRGSMAHCDGTTQQSSGRPNHAETPHNDGFLLKTDYNFTREQQYTRNVRRMLPAVEHLTRCMTGRAFSCAHCLFQQIHTWDVVG